MTDEKPFDVWVEFNDIDGAGQVAAYIDMTERGTHPAVGTRLVAGDGEGNRCPAAVVDRDGARLVLHLDLERFEAAP